MTERILPLVRAPLPKHFGRTPGVYWVATQGFVDELADHLRGKRVLEVFAGNGFLAAHLARAGVDIRATTSSLATTRMNAASTSTSRKCAPNTRCCATAPRPTCCS
jgi:2-polyprenyl-3-methyl-5-hydroxy-6-metoxy-1,4-benzoquinol methylase